MDKVKKRIIFACTVICVFSVQEGHGQGFSQLDTCYWADGLFEVVENSASNTMTCSIRSPFPVWWSWRTNGTEGRKLGYCRRLDCNNLYLSALFSISGLPNGESKLTINTTDVTLFTRPDSFTNSTISCLDDYLGFERTCRTDLIYPAKDSSCLAQFQTSPTKPLVTTCDIPKAYSALQRYSCQVFIAQEAVGSPVAMVATPLGTDYVSGSCSMTSVLPSDYGNITVMIIPGRINVTASSIRKPSSASVDHTCPEYVDEGSNLGCTCTTGDRGSPPGFLQWQGSSSADLSRASVSRADGGTVFTCHLMWNATVVTSATYTLRVTYPAKDSTCNARFERSPNKPWSVVTRCNIPKAYSALNRYSCQGFIAEETVGSPVAMVTTPLGTDYVSGSCSMTSGLPSVGESLTVMIIPGRINVTVSAVKQPSSARVDHSCPPYVNEGSDLGCTCTTEDQGSPPGFLQWQGSSSADLIRVNVSRADDGTVFTCELLWNATVVASKHYALRVTPLGDLNRQVRAEDHTSGLSAGIGIGIGVFLAVALIAVAVLVTVGWRRGWTPPWAASPDTTKQAADNMHSVDASNISQAPRESVGPAAVAGTGNEGQRLYEGIRHSEVNLPSAYEALRPGNRARASAAAARGEPMTEYQNYAFGSDRPADVPAGRKKGKKHEKKAQNESPVYGNA